MLGAASVWAIFFGFVIGVVRGLDYGPFVFFLPDTVAASGRRRG